MKKLYNYLNKPVNFNLDDPEDKRLYEQLQALPHKKFTEETKAYWRKRFKEGEKK